VKKTRSKNCLQKLERLNRAISRQGPDRIPVSDFFWQGFIDNWRKKKGLPEDADINRYYDFDYIVTMPNCDPHIRKFEILKDTEEETVVRTGFDAVIRRVKDHQMPVWDYFETNTIEKLGSFQFDDPWDTRRFFKGGNGQIAGIEEEFNLDIPSWIEVVDSYWEEFPLYGSLCEGYETLWRIIGSENALLWLAMYPEEIGAIVEKINLFAVDFAEAQIQAAEGKLDGMVVWGDVAYNNGMLFSPDYWRSYFKPGVKSIIEVCHNNNLPVMYHGCGDVSDIFEDFIEVGVDVYNPLQVSAGMDVIDMKKKYGDRIAFSGNMGVGEWGNAGLNELKESVLRKIAAGKGGGYIFQSDNSVPDTVSVERYEYVLDIVRECGRYSPLD
jgi:uroporphyrinogen decarboxylase